jgi:hypothetical protein
MVNPARLHEFIAANRADLIQRCNAKAGRRPLIHSPAALDHGVPMFLEQLVDELRATGSHPNVEMTVAAAKHGVELQAQGFTMSQVVHGYGDVCQAVTELAVERKAEISADEFRKLNACLDDAIAGAITAYGHERDAKIDFHASEEDARLVSVTQDLRTAIHVAAVALDVIKSGSVGIAGSTGSVLDMSLSTAHALVDTLLAEYAAKRRPSNPTLRH